MPTITVPVIIDNITVFLGQVVGSPATALIDDDPSTYFGPPPSGFDLENGRCYFITNLPNNTYKLIYVSVAMMGASMFGPNPTSLSTSVNNVADNGTTFSYSTAVFATPNDVTLTPTSFTVATAAGTTISNSSVFAQTSIDSVNTGRWATNECSISFGGGATGAAGESVTRIYQLSVVLTFESTSPIISPGGIHQIRQRQKGWL
jgi:hypothetical protein